MSNKSVALTGTIWRVDRSRLYKRGIQEVRTSLPRSVQLSRELEIDRVDPRWYFGGMKIKTSITLSNEVLKAIDLYIGEYRSRSEFIETAARKFIAQLARKEAERRDLELINRHSDSLNAEAEDVLSYQVPL